MNLNWPSPLWSDVDSRGPCGWLHGLSGCQGPVASWSGAVAWVPSAVLRKPHPAQHWTGTLVGWGGAGPPGARPGLLQLAACPAGSEPGHIYLNVFMGSAEAAQAAGNGPSAEAGLRWTQVSWGAQGRCDANS